MPPKTRKKSTTDGNGKKLTRPRFTKSLSLGIIPNLHVHDNEEVEVKDSRQDVSNTFQ